MVKTADDSTQADGIACEVRKILKDKPLTSADATALVAALSRTIHTFVANPNHEQDKGGCPVHRNSTHDWKTCRSNPANANKAKAKAKGKQDKPAATDKA